MTPPHLDRRSFLELGGSTALLCSLSRATPRDVAVADRAAAKTKKPRQVGADKLTFPTPKPAPGGTVRKYWIQARSVKWSIAPHTTRDEWMGMRITGKRTFTAFAYQLMSEGFATPLAKPRIPGPTLWAEVGDLLEVHFRNADEHFEQAVTMHPHGVLYNPDYDGTYLGDFTHAGGFVPPGEEFTYRWECVPGSEGAWPYHDHGPNHTVNLSRGLFGAVIVYPKGAPRPTREYAVWMHSFMPGITGRDDVVQAINGRTGAGNTPTFTAKAGDDVSFRVFGGDANLHTFHVHGHRWRNASGVPIDNPSFGPHESVQARWREDNPGRWLYHCHVLSHQDAGMAGWYIVDP